MNTVVQFGPSSAITPDTPIAPCLVETEGTLEMGPGLDHDPDMPVMSEDDNSMIDLSASSIRRNSSKENRTPVTHCGLGSCFGLPYQDHNYGAPPPPTPPSFSPPHQSPVRINSIVDEDTNFSVISTSTVNEETHEGSITRCICDYDHDDEYMICCDKCLVWQHVDCMGLDRNNMPETYMCEKCEPRKVDKQKAKILQARKKVALTDTSDESEEDSANADHMCKSKNKHMKRRKEDDKSERKNEQIICKKSKNLKHHKERLEFRHAKLRRRTKSKSDGTSTADEEAQDAWECSLEWFEKYEHAATNQYTHAVQHLASMYRNHEEKQTISEQLQLQLCRVCELGACQKRLVSVCDLSRDQIIIEYRGRFLTAAQFHSQHPVFSKRLFPFVLFYKLDSDEVLCVDATEYGNDARFVRRSCKPNSEIQHVVLNGSILLYISSTKKISKEEEITIPFDFGLQECIKEFDCACDDESCCFYNYKKNGTMDSSTEKKRKNKRSSFTEDDSSQSLPGVMSSPSKSYKTTPVKLSTYEVQQVTVSVSSSTAESSESKLPSEEQENDEIVAKNMRKMTREERKIDAIMRAFDQMEKAAKRRKQALDRIAQQKSQHPKLDEQTDKLEVFPSVAKEEEKQNALSGVEIICTEDEKPTITSATNQTVNQTIKHKKGKRRRGSGTPSRRRTRTNSGGSDILSPDEMLTSVNVLQCPVAPISMPSDVSLAVITSPSSSTTTHNSAPSPGLPLTPVIPKTKRFLMHGWMQEKVESSVPVSCPLSIHTEVSWNVNTAVPTCYVRCTKDSPSAGGISAAHLRRSSTSSQNKQSSGQGSAKKRWLKQAMYECGSCDVLSDGRNGDHPHSPLHNGYLSPGLHIEINSACISPHEDVVTPLKKRRLMRESVESLSSPKSPSTPLAASDWLATSSESPENSCSGPSVEETFPPVMLAAAHQLSTENSCHSAQNKGTKKDPSSDVLGESAFEPQVQSTPKIPKHKLLKADKGMEPDAIASESFCGKYDLVAEQSHHSASTSRSSHSDDVASEKPTCSDLEDSSSMMGLNLSHKVGSSGELVTKRTKSDVSEAGCVSFRVSSGGSPSPGPSAETSIICCDKTDLTKSNDVQPAGVSVLNNDCDDLRKPCISDKDDVLQEPSSTTADCVSSTSSVNNDSGSNPVTSSELPPLPVQSHVSSSCPAEESNILTEDSCSSRPLSGQVSSSTVLCDLSFRSVETETCHASTKSFVTSSVASHNVSTPSVMPPMVSSSVVRCVESSEALNNQNCGTGVSSSGGTSLLPSCEESSNSATSSVSSTAVLCDPSKPQGSESQQYASSGTRNPLNRLSPVQGVSSTSTAHCGSLAGQSSQKRKVSLSEYRKRMRDHAGDSVTSKVRESSTVDSASLRPEILPDHPIELPELPLFEGGTFPYGADHQHHKPVDSRASKMQDVDTTAEEQPNNKITDSSRPREDLSLRLKREFGLDDNSDGEEKNKNFQKNHKTSVSSPTLLPGTPSMVPTLSACSQPPPPPPSTARPSASPQQFSHPVNQSYSSQSCVVAQVSASSFATTQPSVAPPPAGVVPVLCHISSPTSSHPLIQSAHSYSSATHASVPRPPSQPSFPSANCHSYSGTLVKQPPPPPPPPPHQGYRRVFKPTLFK